jgi:hypothetical protein
VWCWQTFRRTVPRPAEPVTWPDPQGTRRILITAGAMAAAAAVFNFIDVRLTIFALAFTILRSVFGRSLLGAIVTGVVLAAVCYLGLAIGLGMVLPQFHL